MIRSPPRPADLYVKSWKRQDLGYGSGYYLQENLYHSFVNAEGPQYLRQVQSTSGSGKGRHLYDNRDTVNKVERMKVTTCLNPLHTALAVYGCVLGYDLIANEMKDEELNKLVHQIRPS